MRHKGWPSRLALAAFAMSFIALGILGLSPATQLNVALGRVVTLFYFAYFWLMPVYSKAR